MIRKKQPSEGDEKAKLFFLDCAIKHVVAAAAAVQSFQEVEGNGRFAAALKDADNNLAKAMNELDFIDKKGKR